MPDINLGQYWRRKSEYVGQKINNRREPPLCLFIKEMSLFSKIASGFSDRSEHDNVYYDDLHRYYELIEDNFRIKTEVFVREFVDKFYVEVVGPRYKDGDRVLMEIASHAEVTNI